MPVFGDGPGRRSCRERYQGPWKEIALPRKPARRARPGILSALREEAEASSYLHSSHSTNKVSPRFISSRKVLRNIKGIGICSLLTHPADPSLAEERLQGLIYPVADD